MVLPPASTRSLSPASNDWHARWIATSELEHAVCTVTAGPRRPSLYAVRLAMKSLSLESNFCR